jgi:hypothetical protein
MKDWKDTNQFEQLAGGTQKNE